MIVIRAATISVRSKLCMEGNSCTREYLPVGLAPSSGGGRGACGWRGEGIPWS